MSWDLCRGGPKHDEIGLVHPRVSFTSPKSLVPIIYNYICMYIYVTYKTELPIGMQDQTHICINIYIYIHYTVLYVGCNITGFPETW